MTSYSIKSFNQAEDYGRVGDFLIRQYTPGGPHLNWVQPRWEYMFYHPFILECDVSKIGVAELDGEIVGVVHFESDHGWIYFQVDPTHEAVKAALFDYAQATFGSYNKGWARRVLAIFIHEQDQTLQDLAASHGFEQRDDIAEPTSFYSLEKPVPAVALPDGFRLQSLEEDNNFRKINQCLWRGFNHDGPPPEEHIPGRKFAQEAPNFRKDLTIVAVAPNGDYASFCGNWYVPENKMVYIEPLATDPDYRRLGLGKAVVYEGIRRAQALGAERAWVGADLSFYRGIGFQPVFRATAWLKYLD